MSTCDSGPFTARASVSAGSTYDTNPSSRTDETQPSWNEKTARSTKPMRKLGAEMEAIGRALAKLRTAFQGA